MHLPSKNLIWGEIYRGPCSKSIGWAMGTPGVSEKMLIY